MRSFSIGWPIFIDIAKKVKKGRPHLGSCPLFFHFFYFLGGTNKNWSSDRKWRQNSLSTIGFENDIEALNGDSKVESASHELPQNLTFSFNIDKHLTSCVRMDVLQDEESSKSISLFLRAWFKFVRFFLGHTVYRLYQKNRHFSLVSIIFIRFQKRCYLWKAEVII